MSSEPSSAAFWVAAIAGLIVGIIRAILKSE